LRGEAGALRHDQLRHALFAFAMQRDAEPAHLAAPLERVALAPRRTVTLTKMFPDHVRFAALLGIGVCVLLGVSHLLWSVATADVRPAVAQFQAIALADAIPTPASSTSVSGAVVRVPVKPPTQSPVTDTPAPPQSNTLTAVPAMPAVDATAGVLRTAAAAGGSRP
jgi:hypothetical protein